MVDFALENIVSVYSGKAGKCCCGCAGKHTYASKHVEHASDRRGYEVRDEEVSDRQVTRVFNKIKALGANNEGGYVWAENDGRLYVAYLTSH